MVLPLLRVVERVAHLLVDVKPLPAAALNAGPSDRGMSRFEQVTADGDLPLRLRELDLGVAVEVV
jgi:hypothetical protein